MALVVAKILNDDAWIRFNRGRFDSDFDRVAFAKDHTNYDEVISFAVFTSAEEAAETAFDISNNPCRQDERDLIWGPVRSLSVGDIVEVWEGETGKTYLCDSVGWTEIA